LRRRFALLLSIVDRCRYRRRDKSSRGRAIVVVVIDVVAAS
jgi:hypothetical protein